MTEGRADPADLRAHFARVETERLVLRQPRAEDAAAMFRIHGDPATNRYTPHGPDPDLAASEATLREWLGHWEADGYGYWAATVREGDEVIGFGGVRRCEWRDREILNLYYRFTPAAWGHGYASELAREAARLARRYLPQLPMVARTRPANLPSIRTAERAGLLRRPDLDTAERLVLALGWPEEVGRR